MADTKTATATTEPQRPLLRTVEGVVASDKGDKTIKVVAEYQTRHPKYGKYLKRRTVLHAHDEKNEAREGDPEGERGRAEKPRWMDEHE